MKQTKRIVAKRKSTKGAAKLVTNTATTDKAATTHVLSHMVGNTKTAMIRNEKMAGRDYVVVPMVMITEGVHNGSNGALYYPAEELRKSANVWNNKPVVVYHPVINGQGVSACTPKILTEYSVGVIMNTKFDKAGRLTAEAYIDPERANLVDKRIMEAVTNKQMMEVSTGLFTDNEAANPGDNYEGEAYEAIARNYQPDHLALLPDQIGACSIKDGAGFIRNQVGVSITNLSPAKREEAHQRIISTLKELNLLDASFEQTRSMLSRLLDLKYPCPTGTEMGYSCPWIEAVYADYLIYCIGGKLFKQSYTATDSSAALEGDASEVTRVTEYKTAVDATMNGNKTPETNQKPDPAMNKKQIVDGLIGNAASGFVEADRNYLMGLSEERLAAFNATPAPAAKVEAPAAPAANAAPAAKVEVPAAPAAGPALNAEQTAALAYGTRKLKEDKDRLIGAITGNKANKFSAEVLNAKSIEDLECIVALLPAAPATNYGLAAGGEAPALNSALPAPLEVPVFNFEAAPAKTA